MVNDGNIGRKDTRMALKCFGIFHRYKRDYILSDQINDLNPYFVGGLKAYVCQKCGKRKLVYPPDAW